MARVAWLIPRLVDGSGGIRTMLQHAWGLERAGHLCHLYIEGVGDDRKAGKRIQDLYGYAFSQVRHGWDVIESADLLVATIWYSAVIARDLPLDCPKIYFVQDYEAWFNPMGDSYLLAEGSYRMGLTPVTIGRWLSHELNSRFDAPALHFDFGADLAVYRPLPAQRRELAVCFLCQPEKPRRCARIGVDALAIVKQQMPEVGVYLYGSKEKSRLGCEHSHLGLLKLAECNALYNRCAVGLSLSATNPSRVPFEMMAAGLPVVEMWRPSTLHDFPPQAVSLAEANPEAIAEALLRLLEDRSLRERMGTAGARFMSERSSAHEVSQFVEVVERILGGAGPTRLDDGQPLYSDPPIVAGARVRSLPVAVRARLNAPPNAYVNSLPPLLRTLLGAMARAARRILDAR